MLDPLLDADGKIYPGTYGRPLYPSDVMLTKDGTAKPIFDSSGKIKEKEYSFGYEGITTEVHFNFLIRERSGNFQSFRFFQDTVLDGQSIL